MEDNIEAETKRRWRKSSYISVSVCLPGGECILHRSRRLRQRGAGHITFRSYDVHPVKMLSSFLEMKKGMFTESYQNTLCESLMSNKKTECIYYFKYAKSHLKMCNVHICVCLFLLYCNGGKHLCTKQNMDPFIRTLFHSATSGQKLHRIPWFYSPVSKTCCATTLLK